MESPRGYKLGKEFPSEYFVQKSIEAYFSGLGFTTDISSHVDLICDHPVRGEKWHIEAKGLTSQPGLDFRTSLGQLVQRMPNEPAKHGIALPKLQKYLAQIEQTSPWAVNRLGIHWLLVDADGSVTVVPPEERN